MRKHLPPPSYNPPPMFGLRMEWPGQRPGEYSPGPSGMPRSFIASDDFASTPDQSAWVRPSGDWSVLATPAIKSREPESFGTVGGPSWQAAVPYRPSTVPLPRSGSDAEP